MTSPPGVESVLSTSRPCQVHKTRHIPNPHVNHIHHVWPLGRGGPDTAENTIVVCPNGHYNIHALLDLFLAHRGQVPYTTLRTFAFEERGYAELGYQRITRGSM